MAPHLPRYQGFTVNDDSCSLDALALQYPRFLQRQGKYQEFQIPYFLIFLDNVE